MNTYGPLGLSDRDRLVQAHTELVKRIAYHMMGRLPPSVQVEDLMQAGIIGLLEAARHYDAAQGASFETYAGIRIRGAMLDELRSMDWIPRSVHRRTREMATAVAEVESREGRAAGPADIARELNISLREYHAWLDEISRQRILSVEDLLPEESDPDEVFAGPQKSADQLLEEDDFKRALADTISTLPEREQLVLSLYYDEELNLREIGEVLGVSESRVSQINSQALVRVRARMAEWVRDGRCGNFAF